MCYTNTAILNYYSYYYLLLLYNEIHQQQQNMIHEISLLKRLSNGKI